VRRNNSCVGAHDFDAHGDPNNDPAPAAVPAYYYVFERHERAACALSGADTNNACYDIKIVSTTSGPGTLDLNGARHQRHGPDERQNLRTGIRSRAPEPRHHHGRLAGIRTRSTRARASRGKRQQPAAAPRATSSTINCDGWKNTLT